MVSSSTFPSRSEPHSPPTPEQKRKHRCESNAKPRRTQERNGTSKEPRDQGGHREAHHRKTSFPCDWPFPHRERSSHSPSLKFRRCSIDRFFESGEAGEHPPPYQQHTGPERPKQHKQWRRRSFPKRSTRRHSDKKTRDTQPSPELDRSPSSPSSPRIDLEREWSKLREAQEQVRIDRQALEKDRAAHEARVRYELEQLGRDIEKERRKLGNRWYQDMEDEEDDYGDAWLGGNSGPFVNGYYSMDEEFECPDYEDQDAEECEFANWETEDEEPEYFAYSACRAYFQQGPTRYMYTDFDGGYRNWQEEEEGEEREVKEDQEQEGPRHRGQRRDSKEGSDEVKKAYDAYTNKWKAISATEPSVPYPTTNLSSASLHRPPDIAVDVPLSPDQIIELNAATFFLMAFDLPQNITTNNAGTPKMELCQRADINQVKALQKQMKMERIRWHPDSLLRRRAYGMIEEAESKGVYRAVDELLEECKVRLGGR